MSSVACGEIDTSRFVDLGGRLLPVACGEHANSSIDLGGRLLPDVVDHGVVASHVPDAILARWCTLIQTAENAQRYDAVSCVSSAAVLSSHELTLQHKGVSYTSNLAA